MNNLTIFEKGGQLLANSTEVAETIGVRHSDLLEKINGYVQYLLDGNFRSVDFFLESTYLDSTGRTLPCYLITKKGCDMIANKLTGKKGVLFTAAYVNGFHKMQEFLEGGKTVGNNVPFPEYIQSIGIAAEILRMNEPSKVSMLGKAYKSYDLPTEFLPTYVEGRVKKSASALLEQNGSPFRAVAFNQKMKAAGFLEQKTRPSKSKGEHKFWSVTEAGKQYGENQVSPNNPRETQPLYYEDTFAELLEKL